MGRVLAFTSGKGGVGKTTIAANVAFGLAAKNRKVALVDLDIGLRNLDLVMGLENKVVYHIGDVLQGICRLKQALIKDVRCSNLAFLPGIIQDCDTITSDGVDEVITQLKREFDYVIIDSPAGLESGFKYALRCADEVFLVVNPEICSIRDAALVKEHILSFYNKHVHLIVNRTRKRNFLQKHYFSTEDIEEMLMLEAIGELPNDEQIIYYINKGEILTDKRLPISKAIGEICNHIIEWDGECSYAK